MKVVSDLWRTVKTRIWWSVMVTVLVMAVQVTSLNGPNVCIMKQKYNITKRVKYRAPMSVRTYEWCFSMPPRCSRWNTEMRDLTRLETEERTAEMAVCCPGFKMKDVSCVPICPNGKTGAGCSQECPPNKWGPNCVHECKRCKQGICSPETGECLCQDGWQGESCDIGMPTTAPAPLMEQLLTTTKSTTATTKMTTSPVTTTTRSLILETTSTSPVTTSTATTENIRIISPSTSTLTTRKLEVTTQTPILHKTAAIYNNQTMSTLPIHFDTPVTEEMSRKSFVTDSIYNKAIKTGTTTKPTKIVQTSKTEPTINAYFTTELSPTSKIMTTVVNTSLNKITTELQTTPTTLKMTTNKPTAMVLIPIEPGKSTTALTTGKEMTIKMETTRKFETTIRQPTTAKFKPKEIWIRPAQKGESPIVETKLKTNQELPHYKSKIKDTAPEITTPKTIIVSIIPTSVSNVSFKKIALTTASFVSHKNSSTIKSNRTTEKESTKPMLVQTTPTPFTIRNMPRKANATSTVNPLYQNVSKSKLHTPFSTRRTFKTSTTLSVNESTNSMSSTVNASYKKLNSSLLTTVSTYSTNVTQATQQTSTSKTSTFISNVALPKTKTPITEKAATQHPTLNNQSIPIVQRNITVNPQKDKVTETLKETKTLVRKQVDNNTNISKRNLTNANSETNPVTDDPSKDEETFHILTEPEHITAVMGDKGTERSSVDLISVISIAGGVMMAIITVAVVIVMLERCRRPRYEDVRKYNDIRMQVMIDKNDIPPPYVRSIFHTPLPDPPTSEKCHYQPISTLDRNLKQFMRPVVVQTISPLMMENFRGILECHYDHLPRRSHDFGTMQTRCSVAPSVEECEELLAPRSHLSESAIEALKCEAKMDVIDNTTSEPLYAEIPCWRPPSEHAIEIVNLNGEAVTEL